MPKHDDADMRAGAQFPIDLTDEVPSLSVVSHSVV
jgi:hypothetical protein